MSRMIAFAAVLTLAVAAPANAQQKPAPKPPVKVVKKAEKADDKAAAQAAEQKKLMAAAKISATAARATALSKVPAGSTVSSEELEREGGRLLYTYDIKVPGKTGIDEVHIDAITGRMIGKIEHEAPKPVKK